MSGTKVQIKYGYGKPQDDSLKKAELAIDLQDNSLWTADADGNIVRVAHDTTEIEGQIEEIVKELTETVVHKNEDNVVEDQFSLRNEDYSLSITGGSYGEIFASFVAGQKIAVAGDGYRSIKYIYKRDGIPAFQVVNADGSASMSISTNGVVQGQDYLDADGNSIIDKIQNNELAIGLLEIQVNGNTTDIGNLETDLGNLQGQVNENTGNISDLETDFGNLQGQVNENTTDIDNLQTDLGKLENRVEQNETDILYLRDDLEALDTDLGELQGQVNTNTGDISTNTGDISDLRNEFENHDHALNDLSDVNTGVPSRDDLLIFNGSNWVADDFAFIETSLRFKGGINMTGTAPSNPENGDLYVNDTAGVVGASWGAIAGTTVVEGKFVGWAEAKGRWYLLGDMASVGVTSVSPGVGISVDDKNPSEPVVSVDKTETDKWYEPKFSKNSGFNKNFGNTSGTVAEGNHTHSNYADVNHNHAGVYEPVINPKNSAFNKNFGTASGTVAQGNHNHDGVYLKNFTETDPTVGQHIKSITVNQIQEWNESYKWGNHALQNYLKSETDPTVPAHVKGITQTDIDKWNNPSASGKTYTSDNGITVNNSTDKISMSGSYKGELELKSTAAAGQPNSNMALKMTSNNGVSVAMKMFHYYDIADDARVYFYDNTNSAAGKVSLGDVSQKLKNAWFAGTVNANSIDVNSTSFTTGPAVHLTNDMATQGYDGFLGRHYVIDYLGGFSTRLEFQDQQATLRTAGHLLSTTLLVGVQACANINSSSLNATPKGNVKSVTKKSTGRTLSKYVQNGNLLVGSLPVISAGIADLSAKGTSSADYDSSNNTTRFEQFGVARYTTSGAAVEGGSFVVVGMPVDSAMKSRTTSIEDEKRNAEYVNELFRKGEEAEYYDCDENGLAGSDKAWAAQTKAGGVEITRYIAVQEDEESHNKDLVMVRYADLPQEQWLFDAWKLDGKNVIVDLDKARLDVLATLKEQAKFYLPRVSCLADIFDEDDEYQKLKDLILGFKSKIRDKSVSVSELNAIMGRIRQEDQSDFAFARF